MATRNAQRMELDMLMSANNPQPATVAPAVQKIRLGEQRQPTCCDQCTGQVGLVTAERAATLCQCSRRKIYHWIDEGHLHFIELVDGTVLVCGRTLGKKIEELSSNTNELCSH